MSITVSDLPTARQFFAPLLEFLGYTVGEIFHDQSSDHDLIVNINQTNGTAFNIWQAEPGLAGPGEFPFGPGGYYACTSAAPTA